MIKAIFLALSIVGVCSGVAYAGCDGNACGDITVVGGNGGFVATNNGQHVVRVEFTSGFGPNTYRTSKALRPGESWTPTSLLGGPIQGYQGNYRATYQ